MRPRAPVKPRTELSPEAQRRRFPRAARVRSGKDFLLARKEGISVRDDALRITLRKRDEGAGARLGLAVSRRVGGAPVRNRMKRIAREMFRQHRDAWPRDHDLVIIPLNAAPLRSPDVLYVRVRRLVSKALARAAAPGRQPPKQRSAPRTPPRPKGGETPTQGPPA